MTNRTSPTVCILMATCNGEAFIAEQVESIQRQSFKDWRLVVSDDGSTDSTIAILEKYARDDSRIVILEDLTPTGSAKDNFTRLVDYADAPYVMFCDQDDVWLSHKIERTLNIMKKEEAARGRKTPILVFTDMAVVDEKLQPIAPSFTHRSHINPDRTKFMQVIAQSLGAGCTMMANMSLIELFKMSSTDGRIIMHDWWLSLLASAFGVVVYIDEPTSLYRQHGSNAVGSNAYSPIESACNRKLMSNRVLATMSQGECFRENYGMLLSARQLKQLNSYIDIMYSKKPLHRLFNLIISTGWKGGTRRLGQLVVVLGQLDCPSR